MRLPYTIALLSFALFMTSASAQWQPYNANTTSGVQAVRSITTQGGAIYLASFPLGVFKSTNDGASFTAVNNGLPTSSGLVYIESVGSNATHIFAGTQSGIYRSADGGASWTLANGTLQASSTIFANKFFVFQGVTFVVMSGPISNGGGVYRSSNNGDGWAVSHVGMSSNMTVNHICSIDFVLYAATSAGIVKSVDNGQNWTGVTGSNFNTYALQGTPTRLVSISDFGYRYSTNGGASWTNSTGGVAAPALKTQLILYDGKYFAITGSTTGVLRSVDQGMTWSAFNGGFSPTDGISQEEFHASGTKLYCGALFDIYSVNGTTTGVSDGSEAEFPKPFPTLFTDGFNVDLNGLEPGSTLLLLDASGREVERHGNLPAGMVRIDRGTLPVGTYRLQLLRSNGAQAVSLGAVIAQ